MITFSNQHDFRVDNQLKVISFLQKNGQCSLNDLANILGVSFTAISKIVNQLIEYGVIKRINKKQTTTKRGRIPVLVKLNTSVGLTCAIDLSSQNISVTLNDLTGKIVTKSTIESTIFITQEVLSKIDNYIEEMLNSKEAENRKLVSICISCPGMINKTNGEVEESFRFLYKVNSSPINYFFNKYGVPTYLYNDIKVACVGEKIYGSIPKDAKNYCFLHLGGAVGAALVFNGKLYQGKNGFSGEFTNYHNTDKQVEKNRLHGLDYADRIIREIDPSLSIKNENYAINYAKADKLYKENNPVFLKGLEECAKANALQIIAYNDFLDLEYFIIEGSILKYQEKYREYLLRYIKQYDKGEFRAKVIFSHLENTASLKGTIYQANRLYFMNRLEEITNERSSTGQYSINESFDDEDL